MTESAPRVRRPIPFGRRLGITLISVAVLPLLVFGAFAVSRIDVALTASADDRVHETLQAIDTVLARRQQELTETTASYATWPVTRTLIDTGGTAAIQQDILSFLVDRGTVDVAMAVLDGHVLGAGDPSTQSALAAAFDEPTGPLDVIVALGGDLYQVSVAPIPATAGGRSDRIIFGRRLDAEFALEILRLTGFDVAVLMPGGRVSVAGDPDAAAAFSADVTEAGGEARRDGIVAGWKTAGTTDDPEAILLVTSKDVQIQSLLTQLPAVLLVTLLVAIVLSIWAAWVLGRGLNRRLAAIHDGLTAMAAGGRPLRSQPPSEPDVQRLAVALDELVAATDRRDRILGDASVAIAELRPEQGVDLVAQAAVDGACSVFDLAGCSLVRADGSVAATSGNSVVEQGGMSRRVETPIETATGGYAWLVGLSSPERPWTEGDGALFGLYARLISGTLRDARVYEDASDRLVRLGRRNELQREFLRSVSHNLQTPLTTISLLADDLADTGTHGTPGFLATRVAAIRAETDRLERLVAQLLTVSRLDAGRVRLQSDAVAIAPLVGRIWTELGSEREFELDDAAGGLIALGDREAIEQIVWILLDNALRYAPAGLIRVGITVATIDAVPSIQVDVADAGPGIPESERRHIFRRFWSGAAGRRRGGTGMGLDIARRLAAAMEGSVVFRPGDPMGSVFVLTLPAEDARPD